MMPLIGAAMRRVAEVQLRLDDGGLRGLHRGLGELDLGALRELGVPELRLRDLHPGRRHLLLRLGRVQVLLRNGPGLGERHVPGDVALGLLEIGLALVELGAGAIHDGGVPRPREIGLGLGELGPGGLERRRVLVALELEQGLPLLDLRAFVVQHLLEHAGDACAHIHRRDRLGPGHEVPDDRDRALLHLGDDHHRGGGGGAFVVLPLGPLARGQGEQQREHKRQRGLHHDADRSRGALLDLLSFIH